MNERKFLIRNVKKARDLINGKLKITPKDKTGDLVTNFDTEIEKFLIKKIKRTYPDFEIISEEFNSGKKLTKNCFVIDPIDGTNNFARKIPIWGIQIACIKNGETVASVIYLPIFEELYSADKTGAYLNDEKIHINNQDEKVGLYSIEQSIPKSFEIQQKNPNCRLFGSAAFSLSMVACGKMSAAMFKDSINPWDLIPGEYLVQKAGGVSFVTKHIRVCANSTNWANIIMPTIENIEQKEIENIPKVIEEEIIPEIKEIEEIEEIIDKIIDETEESEKIDEIVSDEKQTEKISIDFEETDDEKLNEEKEEPKTEKPAKKISIAFEELDDEEQTKKEEKLEAKKPNIEIKEVIDEPSVKEPDFEIEEIEEVLETYSLNIPEIDEPEILETNPEIISEEKPKPKPQPKRPVKRPAVTKSTIRPNLTEARKRKIIM